MSSQPQGQAEAKTLPWTRSCFVCGEANPHGLQLKATWEDGVVAINYVTREADRGYRHIVHGGIAMTVLDEVMTWAAIIATRRVCVAAEMTTRLQRPILVGQALRIEGEVTRTRTRLVLTRGQIADKAGKTLVTASGKYAPMPGDDARLCEKDFVSSPAAVDLATLVGDAPSPPDRQ